MLLINSNSPARKALIAQLVAAGLGLAAVGCADHDRTVYVDETHVRTAPPVVTEPPVVTHERVVTEAPVVTRERVVVVDPPPADRVEVIPAQREGYIWIRGHYVYDGHNYRWRDGHYEAIPRSGAHYVSGRWDRVPGGYVWVEGHWE